MVSNLKMQRPFPNFDQAHTLLLLEEIGIDVAVKDALPHTFITAPLFLNTNWVGPSVVALAVALCTAALAPPLAAPSPTHALTTTAVVMVASP